MRRRTRLDIAVLRGPALLALCMHAQGLGSAPMPLDTLTLQHASEALQYLLPGMLIPLRLPLE